MLYTIGSVDQIKRALVELALEDKSNDEESFNYGTEDISDVEETADSKTNEVTVLNAYNVFSDYHRRTVEPSVSGTREHSSRHHKKFTIKLFVQFIKDQASLCSYKRTVCIGITLITNITDCLTLGIYIIHHMDKVKFVISVIAVALSHCRVHSLKCSLYDVVHLLDLYLILSQCLRMFFRKLADKFLLFILSLIHI